jgi:hypothetical protein
MTRNRTLNRIKQRFTPAQTRKLFRNIAKLVFTNERPVLSKAWLDTIKFDYIDDAKGNRQAIYRIQGTNLQQQQDTDIEKEFYGLDECIIINDDLTVKTAGSIKDLLNGITTAMQFKKLIDSLEEDIDILRFVAGVAIDLKSGDTDQHNQTLIDYMELPFDLLRFDFLSVMIYIWKGTQSSDVLGVETAISNVYLPAHSYDPLDGPALARTDQKIKVYMTYAAREEDTSQLIGAELYSFYNYMVNIWDSFDDMTYMVRALEEIEDLAINILAYIVAAVYRKYGVLPLEDYHIEISTDVGVIDVSPSALFRANLALDLPIETKDE